MLRKVTMEFPIVIRGSSLGFSIREVSESETKGKQEVTG